MKKTFYSIAYAAIITLGIIAISSCEKEEQSKKIINQEKNSISSAFTIEAKYGDIYDRYTIIDTNNYLFNWHRTENGTFVFDTDFYIDTTEVKRLYRSGEDIFTAEYIDGTELNFLNVISDGNIMKCDIMSNDNSIINLTYTFPDSINFMEVLDIMNNDNNQKFASIAIAATIFKLATFGALVVNIYTSIECMTECNNKMEECNNYGCKAIKHDLSGVNCEKKNPSDTKNCNKYDFWC